MLYWTLFFFFVLVFIFSYPFIEIHKKRRKQQHDFDISTFKLEVPVTVILSVYNEVKDIRRKIDEILAEDIWLPGSEFIIISGASDDGTDEIIRSYAHNKSIIPVFMPTNISKIDAINHANSIAKNEVFVFTDCRQIMHKNSVLYLLQELLHSEAVVVVTTLFNRYDAKISVRNVLNKMNISKGIDSNSMNVYGALYVQKRSAFVEIPNNVLFDDLYVLASVLAQGKKIKQSNKAVLEDVNFNLYYKEERIQRLTRGLLLFLFRHFHLIRKMNASNRYHFLMSKYAKLTIPFFFIGFVSCLCWTVLIQENHSRLLLGLSIIGLSILVFFLFKNLKLFIRIVYFTLKAEYLYLVKKKRSVRWEKFQT